MINFCTLFDSNYLSRGLAMYESLKNHQKDFHLYIYAFDDVSFDILKSLKLANVTVISLAEFEDEKLLKIKATRSPGEYCWTCTPSIILHSVERFNLDQCIYIDADIYFFNNVNLLIEEIGDNSILITEHRYTPKYDQTAVSGIYCVQFMYFKNDERGLTALKWWREKCLEWCFARPEDGKFGDQKYLDDWTTRFDGVHVMKSWGGGVAPWNIQQYSFPISNLIFYHYHGFKYNSQGLLNLGNYFIPKHAIKQIYKPYVSKISEIESFLSRNFSSYIKKFEVMRPSIIQKIKGYIKGNHNYYDIDRILLDE